MGNKHWKEIVGEMLDRHGVVIAEIQITTIASDIAMAAEEHTDDRQK